MYRRAAFLALAVATVAPSAAQERAPELEQAKALRARNPDAAERIVRGVLSRKPQDYFALYHLGLIEEVRATRLPPGPERLAHYRRSATWLERAKAVRASQGVQEATIFNTLGVVYLGAGEIGLAQGAFKEAVRNEAALTPSSRGKLYSNIGYLKALTGKAEQAVPDLERGAKLGNETARQNLPRIAPLLAKKAPAGLARN